MEAGPEHRNKGPVPIQQFGQCCSEGLFVRFNWKDWNLFSRPQVVTTFIVSPRIGDSDDGESFVVKSGGPRDTWLVLVCEGCEARLFRTFVGCSSDRWKQRTSSVLWGAPRPWVLCSCDDSLLWRPCLVLAGAPGSRRGQSLTHPAPRFPRSIFLCSEVRL